MPPRGRGKRYTQWEVPDLPASRSPVGGAAQQQVRVGAEQDGTVTQQVDATGEREHSRQRWGAAAFALAALQHVQNRNGRSPKSAPELDRVREQGGAAKLVRDCGDTVISVAISDDMSLFAAGGTNRQINVFSSDSGALVAAFEAPNMINAVVLRGTGDAMRLFAGTYGGQIVAYRRRDSSPSLLSLL